MALLIDSSVFIALERRKQPLSVLGMVTGHDESVALSAITASELLAGAYRADTPERRTRRLAFVESVLEVIPVFPFDIRVARTHAKIWAQLAGVGQAIGAHDFLIAATALAYGYSVLTDNTREFRRVPGLEVKQPSWT